MKTSPNTPLAAIVPELAAAIVADVSDWDLVVRLLHGEFRTFLPVSERIAVRRLADGFGRLVGNERETMNMLWDWSHVRDSSPEAVVLMAARLREFVVTGVVEVTPGTRVRVFGRFDAEVAQVFGFRPDGRIPVLVERDDGTEALPFADEIAVLAAPALEV